MDISHLKVGLVSFHSFQKPGGVKNHILGLAQELRKRGVQVKIIVPRRSRSENYGKDVLLLGTSFPMAFNESQGDFVVNFNPFAIRRVLNREKFDILHLHNFGFPSAFEILASSKATNILTFHSNLEKSKFLQNFPSFLSIFKKIVNWRVHGVIGVSPLIMELFKTYSKPKRVIPNGIDLAAFQGIAQMAQFKDGKINILFVGRLEKRKGLMYLLRAYESLQKKHSNLRLLIAGEGELKEECLAFANTHRLREVHFLGAPSDADLKRIYKSADIFCSPALHGESFGVVLLEAMASRLPIVAFGNKGYSQFFKGKRGAELLAPPRDVAQLALKLESLIQNEPLRKEMADWGFQEVQQYSWESVGSQILAFYQEILEQRKGLTK
ncbi:MAG: glycosyltransferase family 4 protein [bacterium]|nr:glycosyltransferase family 4 protein [bacterium]